MSPTPDLPELPDSQLAIVDDAAFDELARRAGAALRRPAPEAGIQAIVLRQRSPRALKVGLVGGAALVAALLGALVVSQRGDVERLPAVDSVPVTIPTSAAVPSLWVELDPGATAPLPPAPIPAVNGSAMVWTGTELIVWGGLVDDEPCCSRSQDGAAFDPAAGTWRPIAPPPDGLTATPLV